MSSHYIYLHCSYPGCTTSESLYTGDLFANDFPDCGPDSFEGESISVRCNEHVGEGLPPVPDEGPAATDATTLARKVLVDHTRVDIGGCLCGWGVDAGQLGLSHSAHVVDELAAAGLSLTLAAPPIAGRERDERARALAAVLLRHGPATLEVHEARSLANAVLENWTDPLVAEQAQAIEDLRDAAGYEPLTRCVHCRCTLDSTGTAHTEGSYSGLQRCGEESGQPYGLAAHAPGTPCPPHCNGAGPAAVKA